MSFSDQRLFSRPSLLSGQSSLATAYVSRGLTKRGLDIFLAIVAIFAFWPLMLTLSLILYLRKDGPILKRSAVIGRDGVEFEMVQFQSNADDQFARWLETSPLSGLPQLWAVLKGDMSFVGPRPLQLHEFGRFQRMAGLYMKARPGVSGPWRVAQERTLGTIAQARLDRTYVKNATFIRDIGIVLRTPFVLLRLS